MANVRNKYGLSSKVESRKSWNKPSNGVLNDGNITLQLLKPTGWEPWACCCWGITRKNITYTSVPLQLPRNQEPDTCLCSCCLISRGLMPAKLQLTALSFTSWGGTKRMTGSKALLLKSSDISLWTLLSFGNFNLPIAQPSQLWEEG